RCSSASAASSRQVDTRPPTANAAGRKNPRSSAEKSRACEKLAAVALLEVDNVSRRFGGILALDELSLTVEKDEIAGLIGPNGAGKTTAFNVITRLYRPHGGAVRYEGKDLLSEPAHRIVRLGIARTFQNLQLAAHMTVLENVLVGGHARTRIAFDRTV